MKRQMESSVPAKSEQCFTFSPAENYISDDETVVESDPLVVKFASYLDSVFDAPMDFENDVPISAVLYAGMSRSKYLKPSGRSRYTKMLVDDMNEFYRSMGICSIASLHQIQKALLRDYYDFSVICQIAFFLGMEIKELINPSLTVEQIQKEQDSHYMKDAVHVDWELLDAETAPVLERFAKGVYNGTGNENGRPERVSEKLVYREMGLMGHQLENMPVCKAIMERYAESYPESWARKIIWAYQKLEGEGRPFCWTDIRKIAGVKKKNMQLVIPYLIKHTDADTFNRIMELIYGNKDIGLLFRSMQFKENLVFYMGRFSGILYKDIVNDIEIISNLIYCILCMDNSGALKKDMIGNKRDYKHSCD